MIAILCLHNSFRLVNCTNTGGFTSAAFIQSFATFLFLSYEHLKGLQEEVCAGLRQLYKLPAVCYACLHNPLILFGVKDSWGVGRKPIVHAIVGLRPPPGWLSQGGTSGVHEVRAHAAAFKAELEGGLQGVPGGM